jgi:hypothetical protein
METSTYNIMMQKVYRGIWTSDMGSLPAYSNYQNGSKKHGSNGNSFVAQLKNKSQITTCRGNSGNTQSKHFLIKPKCTKRSIQRRFILQRRYTEACRKIYHPGE